MGFDRVEYRDATGPITVDMATGAVSGDLSVGNDTLLGVEIIQGTDYADSYTATGFASPSLPGGIFSSFNAFEGRGGNDAITGNGGTRIEYINATGPVTVNLVAHTADGDASVGHDTFTGVNQVRGSDYADVLLGGNPATNGFEGYDGRGGDDTIDGGSGYDRADYYSSSGPISMGITVHLADGTVSGDPMHVGTDTLQGIEAIRGSYKDDVYDASGFDGSSTNAGSFGMFNDFEGMAGDDLIIGNGSTRLSFGLAREGVVADLSTGNVFGGPSVGHDTFSGVNAVNGSNFDDVLYGSNFYDNLAGGFGNDLLHGGGGADFINGGPGSDVIDFDSLFDAGDTILGFATGPGGDVLDIADLLANWTTYANGAGGPLADYVRVDSVATNAIVQIDADGAGAGAGLGWETLAVLDNGAGIDLDALLAGGNLDYML